MVGHDPYKLQTHLFELVFMRIHEVPETSLLRKKAQDILLLTLPKSTRQITDLLGVLSMSFSMSPTLGLWLQSRWELLLVRLRAVQVVELLVDDPQLCSVAAADLWRCTPLHRAAEGGFSDVALVLLKKAADPQKADRDGNSPLHFASTSGCQELVEELLKRQVPLNFANNDGFSPLDLCVSWWRHGAKRF